MHTGNTLTKLPLHAPRGLKAAETLSTGDHFLDLEQIVRLAREYNMHPVWSLIATLALPDAPEEAAELIDRAQRKGFNVLDLSDVYAEQDITSIIAAE